MGKKPEEDLFEFLKIGNRAVKKAQEINWKKGLPNVYSKNKKIYFEYPDDPDKKKDPDKS